MSVIKKWLSVYNRCAQTCAVFILRYCGEVTSQHLWPRYDRHFVGITCHNVRSKKNNRPSETMLGFFYTRAHSVYYVILVKCCIN